MPPAQPTPADYLLSAQREFDQGRFAIAELILRNAPDSGNPGADAANLRGRCLLALNLRDLALAAFRRALELNPYSKPAKNNLAKAEAAPPRQAPAGPRYLIIREWMEGFWSDVDHAVAMCAVAEACGRQPIVHWGAQSRYAPPQGGNAWDRFFQPVSSASLEEARRATAFYPPKWNANNLDGPITERGRGPHACSCALDVLSRDEAVVVSDMHCAVAEILPYMPADHPIFGRSVPDARHTAISRSIKARPEILQQVEHFTAKHFRAPMLGVHFRGTDKVSEQRDLAHINAQYPAAIERHLKAAPDARIFLLTDSDPFAQWCTKTYGDRLITTAATRSAGAVGLHYMGTHADPALLGAEVLLDTLLGARCDRFIGLASSNVSIFVRDLKEWVPGTCELFGIAFNDRPNVFAKLNAPPPRKLLA